MTGSSNTEFIPALAPHEDVAVAGNILDSHTSQIDDAILEKFEKAIHKQTALFQHTDVMKMAVEHDPIDLARASTRVPLSARLILYRNLPDIEAKIAFVINTTSPTRVAIFRSIPDEEIRDLMEHMPPDDAVSVLDDLPFRRVKRVFELLDEHKARRIAALQQHRRDTAGRLMTNEFFAFHQEQTVGQVAQFIHDHPGVEFTHLIFVLGDSMELLGFVPDRNLIVNPQHTPLRTLMRPVVHRVRADTPRDEIVELFERYRLAALPVVDHADRLIGVITHTDVIEMMEEMADETIANIGGTAERITEDEPTWRRFISRVPWLIVTLFAGLLTATGFSIFYDQPWFLAVPFFVPLITGMSGNVGIQCSTVLIRSMATGEVSSGTVRAIVLRELRIGAVIGVSFGIMCGLAAYGINLEGLFQSSFDPLLVGTIVSAGVLGACFVATALGTLSPLLFSKWGIDPAIASGPIVTACNDVLSTYMYFFVAWFVAMAYSSL